MFVACNDAAHHQIFAVDPVTFQLSEYEMAEGAWRNTITSVLKENLRLNASSDGSVLGGWLDRAETGGLLVVSTSANRMECSNGRITGSYACPDDFGDRIYTSRGLLNAHGVRIDEEDPAMQTGVLAVPAIGGPYYLTVPSNNRVAVAPRTTNRTKTAPPSSNPLPTDNAVAVYVVGEPKPVTTLPLDDFRLPKTVQRLTVEPPVLCRRLFFIPAAQVIAEITDARNAVVLHHLNLDEKWNRADLESPVVVSRPPRSIHVGETLSYQIQTISKSGKPVYKLDTAPEGMTLSESGLLQWTPAARPESGSASAVISIADSGQTKYHAIVLEVRAPEEVRASASQGPADHEYMVPVAVSGGKPAAEVPAAAVSAKPADDVQLKLPATYDDVRAGGGGRYLVLSIDSLQKLAIVHLATAKIIGYVPIEGKRLFAAGADKLVVVNPAKAEIQRFDLLTQKLEVTQPLPNTVPKMVMAMGAASHGPVLFGGEGGRFGGQPVLLDLDSLQPIACKLPARWQVERSPAEDTLRVSADGHVFAAWRGSGSPSGFEVFSFDGQELADVYQHISTGSLLPNETGDRIYTTGGIYSNQGVRLDPSIPRNANPGTAIPAVQGPFYLRIIPEGSNLIGGPHSGPSAAVYLAGETQPLLTLRDLPVLDAAPAAFPTATASPSTGAFYLVPGSKLLALLPERRDSIVIRRFDPEEELQRSGRDYLVVQSVPPGSVAVGQKFQYQVVVKAKDDKVSYRLESGPEGMTVSPSGLVQWDATARPPTGVVQVVVGVVGPKQTLQHSFTVQVTSTRPTGIASMLPRPASPQPPVAGSPTTPVAPVASGPWQLTKVDDHRLKISEGEAVLTPGWRYQSMLFLQGNHLAVLGADGITISKIRELATTYKRIAERADYYVAIVENPPAIDLLNKNTLATIRRINCTRGRPFDLAIHPTQPISYVSVVPAGLQANGAFVIVDEKSGEIRDSQNYLGQWLAVDAAGQRLLAAGTFSRIVGQELLVVPRGGPATPPRPQPAPRPGAAVSRSAERLQHCAW